MARSHSLQRYAPDSRNGARVAVSLVEQLERMNAALLEKVARSGARAGALVFYDEMRRRVHAKEGTLRDAIYHYHDEDSSSGPRQRYLIGPNKRKAPHWFWVEYGHWRTNVTFIDKTGRAIAITRKLATPKWVPAKPYVRPTFDAQAPAAVQAALKRMAERFTELTTGAANAATAEA